MNKIIALVFIVLFFTQCSEKTLTESEDVLVTDLTKDTSLVIEKSAFPIDGINLLNEKEIIQEAFFDAIQLVQDTNLIIDLIAKGADVNYIGKGGEYSLLLAKNIQDSKAKESIINILVDLGAIDINPLIEKFFGFCEQGNIDSLKKMLANGYNINYVQKHYEYFEEGGGCGCMCEKGALFIAVKNKNIELVNFLIENGIDVFLEEGALQPLEPAIASRNWDIAKILVEKGASKVVSKCNWSERYNLSFFFGSSDFNSYYQMIGFQDTLTFNFLREYNFPYPNLDASQWFSSPIDHVVLNQDTLILHKLIKLNSKRDVLSRALCFTDDISIAKVLIKYGADPNYIYSWHGEEFYSEVISPLYTAIKLDDIALVNLYIDHGADVNILYNDYNGESLKFNTDHETFVLGYPLLIAADKGHMEIVRLLLKKGAKVDFAVGKNYHNNESVDLYDENKRTLWQTPLVAAVNRNDKAMVKLLLDNSAPVIVKGDTILNLNYLYQNKIDEDIQQLLIERLKAK